MISGSPGLAERVNNPLLHHKVRDFRTQFEVFEKICVAGDRADDPAIAFREIDRVLDAARASSGPVYRDPARHGRGRAADRRTRITSGRAASDPRRRWPKRSTRRRSC